MEIKKYKLTEICDFQGGSQPPKKEWSKSKKEGYARMLQIRDFTQSHKDNVEYVKASKRLKTCKTDDILIGRYGASIGKILTGLEGAYNVAIMKTIPDEKIISKKYLLAILKAPVFQNFILNVGVRAAQAGFNKDDLSKFHLYIPSLDNQKRIAKVLSDCENIIQKRKESIELLDKFLKSTFLEMFGDPVNNEKEWKIAYFDELVHENCPLTYGIVQPGNEFLEGVPVARPVDLKNDYIGLNGLKKIDPAISKKFSRTLLNGGEILMCVRGTTGVVSIAKDELKGANVTRGLTPIWFDNKMESLFAFNLIRSIPFQRLIQSKTYGIALKQINLKELRKLRIINPPKELQLKFNNIAKNIDKLKTSFSKSLSEIENLYGSISQKSFKGELDLSKVDISLIEESSVSETNFEALSNEVSSEPVTIEKLEQIIKSRFIYQEFSISQIEEIMSKQGIDYTTSLVKGFIKDLLSEEKIRTEYSGSTHQVIFKYNQ